MDSVFDILRNVQGVALAVLFFGGTIFVHELGHFLAAKKRGLKVERFSIGFGPRVWGWTGKDGVDYRISLFPLGGYVALPQMADMSAVEGETKDDAEKLPKIGYADKMIVAVMGAAFNVLFAIVLACLLSIFGRPEPVGENSAVIGNIETELSVTPGGAKQPAPAAKADLRPGDRILAVDGRAVATFNDVRAAIALGSGRDAKGPLATLTIERDGKTLPEPVEVRPLLADIDGSGDTLRMIGIGGGGPVFVDVNNPKFPAASSGMKTGDRIVSINGVDILSPVHLKDYLAAVGERAIDVVVERKESGALTRVPLHIEPALIPLEHPLLTLEFSENGVSRRVDFVPVPEQPQPTAKSLAAPRTLAMVREGLPPDSEYAAIFATGNLLTGVSGSGSVTVQRTANFEAVIAEAKGLPADGALSLYLRDGERPLNATLHGATFSVTAPAPTPFIGISPALPMENVRRAPWVYLGDSFSTTFNTLVSLLSPKSDVNVKHLTGVLGISRIYFGISQNILMVLWFTLVLNVNLAIMNLLPLPVLDGGHMVYATWEKLFGKPLHRRVVEVLQTAFVVILFGLMAFVLWRDIARLRASGAADRRDLVELFVRRMPEFPAEPAAILSK